MFGFARKANRRILGCEANAYACPVESIGIALQTTTSVKTPSLEEGVTSLRHVYVIDDDRDMRKSLHFLLASSSITAWPFAAARDFIEQLPDLAPAPILLDLRMPKIDGLDLLTILKKRAVTWPVIMLTAHGNVTSAVRAMKLGAIEFIEKPFDRGMLMHALDHAFAALDQITRSTMKRAHVRSLFGKLTKREREVVAILMEGAPNKLVAHRLDISVRTVEQHRSSALAKLEVKSMAEIMTLWVIADFSVNSPSELAETT